MKQLKAQLDAAYAALDAVVEFARERDNQTGEALSALLLQHGVHERKFEYHGVCGTCLEKIRDDPLTGTHCRCTVTTRTIEGLIEIALANGEIEQPERDALRNELDALRHVASTQANEQVDATLKSVGRCECAFLQDECEACKESRENYAASAWSVLEDAYNFGQFADDAANVAIGEREAFLTWWCADVPEYMREKWKESVDECLRNNHAQDKLVGAWDGFQFGLTVARAALTAEKVAGQSGEQSAAPMAEHGYCQARANNEGCNCASACARWAPAPLPRASEQADEALTDEQMRGVHERALFVPATPRVTRYTHVNLHIDTEEWQKTREAYEWQGATVTDLLITIDGESFEVSHGELLHMLRTAKP